MNQNVLFRSLLISCSIEGEATDKAPDPRTGSAIKFEEGLGTTEGDGPAEAEGTGDQPDGL